MSDFEHTSRFVETLGGRLHQVEGTCDTHGKSTVLARAGLGWYCPRCMEDAKVIEYAEQWATERQTALHAIAEIPSKYRGQKFTPSMPDYRDKQKAVRAIAASFRDFIIAEARWSCLILVGDVGTGKTQLACEFAESLINRLCRSVRYVTAKGMISEIQASYGREGKSEDSEIDRFVQYDILILDEIDAIPAKDNAALLLTEIINRRYGSDKPMIVITNQSLDNLAKFIGDRVVDRMHENAFICEFDWPSFRRQTRI
jgi:DNA replication protein DnaC